MAAVVTGGGLCGVYCVLCMYVPAVWQAAAAVTGGVVCGVYCVCMHQWGGSRSDCWSAASQAVPPAKSPSQLCRRAASAASWPVLYRAPCSGRASPHSPTPRDSARRTALAAGCTPSTPGTGPPVVFHYEGANITSGTPGTVPPVVHNVRRVRGRQWCTIYTGYGAASGTPSTLGTVPPVVHRVQYRQ